MKKRVYSTEFKSEAVRLSYQRENIKELADELGVQVQRIYKWRAGQKTKASPKATIKLETYKCGKCNKTANANTRPKSINDGLNEQFRKSIDTLQFSKSFHNLFSKQLEKIIDTEMSGSSEKKRLLKNEINELQQSYDDMEYRFAVGKISEEIFDKHGLKLKTKIDEKSKQLLNLPSKKSNHQNLLKRFLKIAKNPGEFYESLNYNDKRVFQNIVFPEGFMFSLKNKECRTSKMNIIFDLTNSFKDAYGVKIKKTQIQKVLESRIVAGTGLEPVTFGL
jgi:site-specific DNA recombinase